MQQIELVFCIGLDALLLIGLISSVLERQLRAAIVCALGIIINSSFWATLIYYSHVELIGGIGLISIASVIMFGIVSLIRFFPPSEKEDKSQICQYDERDHMFSRNNLQFHPELADKYYNRHPELFEIDKAIHEKSELGQTGGRFYDTYLTAAAESAFKVLAKTGHLVTGSKEGGRDIEPAKMAEVITQTAFRYGAVDVGFATLKEYHFYSHAGRRADNWGQRIENNHKSAIVIIVAMDVDMIRQAPGTAVILESSRAYVEAAKIAHIIAEYIRSFGYDAKSHVDGRYEVLCVPLAADASLGQVGRMGLLMHPVYGPCVRISAVTTELQLSESKGTDCHIENFCRICRKCASNCPTGCISTTGKTLSRGFEHYSIQQHKCYSFWKDIGTDCGVCISVCPYTKPNTLFHRLARFYVSRNRLNQRVGLFVDDLLYGPRIKLKPSLK
jgi:reductive dehalogenase